MAAIKFAELIKERSNGHVEIQVFPNGVLYKDGEEMNALLRGDIQMIALPFQKLLRLYPNGLSWIYLMHLKCTRSSYIC